MSADEPTIFCIDCGYPLEGLSRDECPECGRAFDPGDASTYAQDVGRLVKLYVSGNLVDVYLLKEMLEAEGIRSMVLGSALQSARGELPLTGETLPSLWVGDRQAPQALEIAAAFDQRRRRGPEERETPADWTCPACGERIEGQFSACWSCGAERAQP